MRDRSDHSPHRRDRGAGRRRRSWCGRDARPGAVEIQNCLEVCECGDRLGRRIAGRDDLPMHPAGRRRRRRAGPPPEHRPVVVRQPAEQAPASMSSRLVIAPACPSRSRPVATPRLWTGFHGRWTHGAVSRSSYADRSAGISRAADGQRNRARRARRSRLHERFRIGVVGRPHPYRREEHHERRHRPLRGYHAVVAARRGRSSRRSRVRSTSHMVARALRARQAGELAGARFPQPDHRRVHVLRDDRCR